MVRKNAEKVEVANKLTKLTPSVKTRLAKRAKDNGISQSEMVLVLLDAFDLCEKELNIEITNGPSVTVRGG